MKWMLLLLVACLGLAAGVLPALEGGPARQAAAPAPGAPPVEVHRAGAAVDGGVVRDGQAKWQT